MNELLSQLRDIRGLDRISVWPLAPGWYGVITVTLCLAVFAALLWWLHTKKIRGWRAQMMARLTALRDSDEMNFKEKAAALSEWLRIAAIRKHGRDACAGLSGRAWLSWLSAKDPKGYNWAKAVILTEAPYAPVDRLKQPDYWDELLRAAERWVH